MKCFLPSCKHYNLTHKCCYFRFPKEPLLLKAWIQLTGCKEPTDTSRICSCHFVNGDRKLFPTIVEVANDEGINTAIAKSTDSCMVNISDELPFEITFENKHKNTETICGPKENENIVACDKNYFNKSCLQAQIKNHKDHKRRVTFSDDIIVNEFITKASAISMESEIDKNKDIISGGFGVNQLKDDDEHILLYTGFPNSQAFKEFLVSINNIIESSEDSEISRNDQILITLMHLNSNYSTAFLSRKYTCPTSTIENIIQSWGSIIEDALEKRRQSKRNRYINTDEAQTKQSEISKAPKLLEIMHSKITKQQGEINNLLDKSAYSIRDLDEKMLWDKANQIIEESEAYHQSKQNNKNKERMTLEKMLHANNAIIQSLTGFTTKDDLVNFIKSIEGTDINYQYKWKVELISPADQILMSLIYLHSDYKFSALQEMFQCAQSTVSNVLASWKPILLKTLPFATETETEYRKRKKRKSTDTLYDIFVKNEDTHEKDENFIANNLSEDNQDLHNKSLNDSEVWDRVDKTIREAEDNLITKNFKRKFQQGFRLENLSGNELMVKKFTGFKSFHELSQFIKEINEKFIGFETPQRGRLSRDDQVLMTLMNLWSSEYTYEDIAAIFKCKKETVYNVVTQWKPYLKSHLKNIPEFGENVLSENEDLDDAWRDNVDTKNFMIVGENDSIMYDHTSIVGVNHHNIKIEDVEEKEMFFNEDVSEARSLVLDEETGDLYLISDNDKTSKICDDDIKSTAHLESESNHTIENETEIEQLKETSSDDEINQHSAVLNTRTEPVLKRGKRKKVREKLTLSKIIDNNNLVKVLTGFRSGSELKLFIDSIKTVRPSQDIVILKVLSIEDQILLTLMKLVRNATHLFLSTKFKCSLSIVRKALAKWGPFIFKKLKTIDHMEKLVLTTVSRNTQTIVNKIMENDKNTQYYTGFNSRDELKQYVKCFETLDITYHHKWKVSVLNREEQVLLVLAKIARNYTNIELSQKFNCSIGTVRNIILSWHSIIQETFPKPFVVENVTGVESETLTEDPKPAEIYETNHQNAPVFLYYAGDDTQLCDIEKPTTIQIEIPANVKFNKEFTHADTEVTEIQYVTEVPLNYEEIEVEEVSLYSPIEDEKLKLNSQTKINEAFKKTGNSIEDIWARADSILAEAEKTLLATPIRKHKKETDRFGLDMIIEDPNLVTEYTGFTNSEKLKAFIKSMEDYEVSYHHKWKVEALSHKDQIMMTLLNFNTNFNHTTLSTKFKCSKSTVRNVISTWRRIFNEVSLTNPHWDLVCELTLAPYKSVKKKRKLDPQHTAEVIVKRLKKRVKWDTDIITTYECNRIM